VSAPQEPSTYGTEVVGSFNIHALLCVPLSASYPGARPAALETGKRDTLPLSHFVASVLSLQFDVIIYCNERAVLFIMRLRVPSQCQ
jgi:hypothetical protein